MRKFALIIGIIIIMAGAASITYSRMPEINQQIQSISPQVHISTLPPEDKMLFTIQNEEATYVVELTNPVNMASIQQESVMANIQSIGATVDARYIHTVNAVVVTASPSEITNIASMNDVARIYKDEIVKTLDGNASAGMTIGGDLRAQGYDGSGVMVFVIDSGIDDSVPQLQRNGQSVVKVSYSLYDTKYTHWHGTFCASLIIGVASGADLGSVCVFDNNGEAMLSDVLDGIDFVAGWHRTHREFVVASCSWGISPLKGYPVGDWNHPDIISEAINELSSQGVPVVVAAGNDGRDRSINSPGAAQHCLTVGAVDANLNIASFSSRGPTMNGNRKPDVVSYGANIQGVIPGGDTMVASGTSFSTPMVAGIVADLAQKYGKDYTSDQYYSSIRQSAIDLGPVGWDATYGYGFVNGTAAFNVMSTMTPREVYFNAGIGMILIGLTVTVSPLVRRKYGY